MSMYKFSILSLILCLSLLLAACSNVDNNLSKPSTDQKESESLITDDTAETTTEEAENLNTSDNIAESHVEETENPSNTAAEEPHTDETFEFSDLSCNLIVDTNLLKDASSGKLPGVDVSRGMSIQEIEQKYGEPDKIGNDISSGSLYYHYNGCTFYFDPEDKVRTMTVKFKMTPTQFKELIGEEPYSEGISPINDNYGLYYQLENDYRFYIHFPTEESDKGLLLYKIN
ncbi:DUF4309 domain-containing protein [Chengkuizengella axinellae]|uniref:DUF4309 domain-containing protein n=1 Tax=Chengkuizengella axinellae TaxID=3064388 RepID=A0ABT9IYM0_9BACL|nr:DUF4309 domain-containing protein [Chengkuizengella sp. 2205SS18-9]MDP5274247.1 DUF4309 domain-containing protein [Chengkuizengella sp. 2205SS18-9]